MKRVKLSLSMIFICSALAVAMIGCSGGGGGGGNDGGVIIDNSRANGAYTYVAISGETGFGIEVGTITFNGAGSAVYSGTTSTSTGSLTYTVTTDNAITIDGTLIGTMRNSGGFFVAADTSSGKKTMIVAVKQSSHVETSTTFLTGRFEHNIQSHLSQAGIMSMVTASPSSGLLTITDIVSATTETVSYLLSTATGTVSIPDTNPGIFGALSADNNILIFGDGETNSDSRLMGACGLKLPGSGMANASLSGTYLLYQFRDDNVGVGSFVATRGRITFNGTDSGTYTEIANSTGTLDTGGMFSYSVNSDGTFVINGLQGVVIQDGGVFAMTDYDATDNSVAVMIGVK
jgi:hypothetical protein